MQTIYFIITFNFHFKKKTKSHSVLLVFARFLVRVFAVFVVLVLFLGGLAGLVGPMFVLLLAF